LFRDGGTLTAEQLGALRAADCTRIFGQDPENAPIQELMSHFARALNELGELLAERYRGSGRELIEAADGSAARLVEILGGLRCFDDVSSHDGQAVPFYKRAQIAVADLALAFDGQGLGGFRDLDQLTIFADNLVPHVLRVDGVLEYDPELAAAIDGGELLVTGSPQEVEIRASALWAVELMVAALDAAGRAVTAMQFDYLLWNRGQEPFYKARPRHRARSLFY
jgi:hypothetical protein